MTAGTSLRIGPWVIPAQAAVLAPMAGVTDRPFRILCRGLGAAFAVSEMIAANPRLWNTSRSRLRRDHGGEPEPRIVQLAGADPEALAAAARMNVDLGAQIIDINMGCPAKKVCNRMCGSALLRDEALVARILEAVVNAVGVPVTLKIRTGWSRSGRNGVRIARMAEACGVRALAVHGRTREDLFRGAAEYETMRDIRREVRIPVFANGDIDSAPKARAVLDFTGATGVMIGRAAHGAPWIFRDVNSLLTNGVTLAPLAPAAQGDIILAHLDSLYAFYGEQRGVLVARKHLGWYCDQLPDLAPDRRLLMAADSTTLQFELAKRRIERWRGRAAAAA